METLPGWLLTILCLWFILGIFILTSLSHDGRTDKLFDIHWFKAIIALTVYGGPLLVLVIAVFGIMHALFCRFNKWVFK